MIFSAQCDFFVFDIFGRDFVLYVPYSRDACGCTAVIRVEAISAKFYFSLRGLKNKGSIFSTLAWNPEKAV